MTALVRLAKAAAWYVPQILTQHHSRKTRAWIAAHPPPGQQYGATWVARRRQDIDESAVTTDTVEPSYGGSDTTPQAPDQGSSHDAAGLGLSPVHPDVLLALDWVKRNPGIGLTHFKPDNHRHQEDAP